MKLFDAQTLARELMRQHGLTGWTFQFDNATRRFGQTSCGRKIISLSKPLTELNSEACVKNVILHEIAHALTPGTGHAWRWKLTAQAIGCDGKPRYDGNEVLLPPTRIKYKWAAICDKHNIRILRKGYTLGLICKRCCNELNFGRYSPEYQLRWENLERGVKNVIQKKNY
jgi:predicted SprT family Zn-dependent metalloprotease